MSQKIKRKQINRLTYSFFDFFGREKSFLIFVSILIIFAAAFYQFRPIAMWFGFGLAAFSAVSNDSIQTLGTFIASNGKRKWWVLWLFIGAIFIVTIAYGWYVNDGDVTWGRLMVPNIKGDPSSGLKFPEVKDFSFLQILAPILLLLITRMRMPVSTTFLLLSTFAANSGAIGKVLAKSLTGYVLAFVVAFIVWILLSKLMKRAFKGEVKPIWTVLQWITSGSLWCMWLIQDAANIAIYLPRKLDLIHLIVFISTIFFGLGVIFYLRGDKIQRIVNEKSDVEDVRPATIIDFVYSLVILLFTIVNPIPMSTTWVFLGILGGRELAMALRKTGKSKLNKSVGLISKDVFLAMLGLALSIILAIVVNPSIREGMFDLFK